jgi:bisanhydrobacterioruberin hydratase
MKNTLAAIKKRCVEARVFFIIFYFIGITGILIPFSFSFFLTLFPFALILSFIGLALFHLNQFDKKSILIYLFIYISGFIIESAGVNTKLVFGGYKYGESLGIKLFNTPLIIGLNWLLLVYLSSSILEKAKIGRPLKIFYSSTIMLIYDIVLEQAAPKLDLWNWDGNTIPVKNYISWFIIALFFNSLIGVFRVKTENKLAFVILICQLLFFINLFLFLK